MNNSNNQSLQRLYSKEQTAEILGVSPTTVERWTASGRLPARIMPSGGRVGRPRRMWAIEDIERFIDSCAADDGSIIAAVSVSKHRRTRRRPSSQSAAMDALAEAGVL